MQDHISDRPCNVGYGEKDETAASGSIPCILLIVRNISFDDVHEVEMREG